MRAFLTIVACAIVLGGCRAKEQESSGDVAPDGAANTPALAVTQAAWTPDALDELLAPIALYPDQLLGQVLAASVNAQEVLDAGNWLLQNQNLKGDQIDAEAQKAGFGPATRALVHFPTVVDMMCQEIDWTRQVGAAFTSDQKAVLDAVQRLRAQAADVGNLTSTPQQTVERKAEGGNTYIEVKPADPQVVYVPQYNPEVIYTTPPPSTTTQTTTTTTSEGTVSTGSAVAAGLLAFGVGMLIGSAMDNDYCYPHWGAGAVYYGPRPFYPPAYVYRPIYGPAFRPAYGYRPPAGYRYSYNSGNNIVINNNNYYTRFNNQQNLRTGARNPAAGTRQAGAGNRVGQQGRGGENWRGQSTYAGARGGANDRGPATTDRRAGGAQQRAAAGPGASRPSAERNTRSSQAQARPAARPNDRATTSTRDRGYGGSSATPSVSRDAAARTTTQARSQPNASRESGGEVARQQPRESALSGASQQGTGSFDRAASARGRASAPAARQTASRSGRRQ